MCTHAHCTWGHMGRLGRERQALARARSATSAATSVGVVPTSIPRASSASFFPCAVPEEPEMIAPAWRSEEHTSELQSRVDLVCRLLLEKKKKVGSAHPPIHKNKNTTR